MDEFLRIIGFDWQLVHDVALTAINVLILFFALSYLLFDPARDFLEKKAPEDRRRTGGGGRGQEDGTGTEGRV